MIPLDQIKVAAPCRQSWDEMDGDAQARFCQSCRQNVYNLSEMTRTEAAKLIREKEGHLCVRFFRRTDGTIMTRDCPVGIRAMRLRFAAAFSGLVTLIFGGGGCNNTRPIMAMGIPIATMGGPYYPTATTHHAPKDTLRGTRVPEGFMGKVRLNNVGRQNHNTTTKHAPAAPPQALLGEVDVESFEYRKHHIIIKPSIIRPKLASGGKHTKQK